MNIFVLDTDPKKAAEYHCNKHVVKMILESCQMLCGAHWYGMIRSSGKSMADFKKPSLAAEFCKNNFESSKIPPWTFTHVRHPCSVWTAETIQNYQWHLILARSLLDEYTLRYGKKHSSEKVWQWLLENSPMLPSTTLTQHPQCMPDECKVPNDPVSAYRKYYINHKKRFAVWEPRAKKPYWFGD